MISMIFSIPFLIALVLGFVGYSWYQNRQLG